MAIRGQLQVLSLAGSVLHESRLEGHTSISSRWFLFAHLLYYSLTQFLILDTSSTYVFPIIIQSPGNSHQVLQSKGGLASLISIMAVIQGCHPLPFPAAEFSTKDKSFVTGCLVQINSHRGPA